MNQVSLLNHELCVFGYSDLKWLIMAKIICLCNLHNDHLIHICVATKTCTVKKALCGLLLFFLCHLVFFFSKIPNLASTIFTYKPTGEHKTDWMGCKNLSQYVDKYKKYITYVESSIHKLFLYKKICLCNFFTWPNYCLVLNSWGSYTMVQIGPTLQIG